MRLARLVVNAYLENVDLVVRTIGEFGEEAERSPGASQPIKDEGKNRIDT